MLAGRVDQPLVDELLRRSEFPAALAHGDLFRPRRERKHFRVHQRVVEHDAGSFE
ncbi:hypothetical protein D3C83_140150 [compost metagenome]